MKILNENVSKNIIGELNKKSLKEGFKGYNFTNESEFGSLSNTDALDTIRDLIEYFGDYSKEIYNSQEGYIDDRKVMDEVATLLYQAEQKLQDSWDNM